MRITNSNDEIFKGKLCTCRYKKRYKRSINWLPVNSKTCKLISNDTVITLTYYTKHKYKMKNHYAIIVHNDKYYFNTNSNNTYSNIVL